MIIGQIQLSSEAESNKENDISWSSLNFDEIFFWFVCFSQALTLVSRIECRYYLTSTSYVDCRVIDHFHTTSYMTEFCVFV